jgi:hypothetical protein
MVLTFVVPSICEAIQLLLGGKMTNRQQPARGRQGSRVRQGVLELIGDWRALARRGEERREKS